jgi:hypothetical protein
MIELGGFQAAANLLTDLSGREWSRQSVQQLYKRRKINRFPPMVSYSINGKIHKYFPLRNVSAWYYREKYRAVLEKK